ncbi:hypothetical protein EVAR_86976_1 [Eumeta japonica]|uniref:Uncharacterized protein n=1 Tax=Eumeta variegata TaxID=151549 RepID=A0A4C1W6T2_EUMVA|nr:hypothetical protein EVAR_86976_1 [Eumeta japonica]
MQYSSNSRRSRWPRSFKKLCKLRSIAVAARVPAVAERSRSTAGDDATTARGARAEARVKSEGKARREDADRGAVAAIRTTYGGTLRAQRSARPAGEGRGAVDNEITRAGC